MDKAQITGLIDSLQEIARDKPKLADQLKRNLEVFNTKLYKYRYLGLTVTVTPLDITMDGPNLQRWAKENKKKFTVDVPVGTVDFTPMILGKFDPEESLTLIFAMAFASWNDFFSLLAEPHSQVPKPKFFMGKTSVRMARIARRFGFQFSQPSGNLTSKELDEIKVTVFADVSDVEKKLKELSPSARQIFDRINKKRS